jgi:hypothetical protein
MIEVLWFLETVRNIQKGSPIKGEGLMNNSIDDTVSVITWWNKQ